MERLKGQTTINDHLYDEQGQKYVEALSDVIVVNGHKATDDLKIIVKYETTSANTSAVQLRSRDEKKS